MTITLFFHLIKHFSLEPFERVWYFKGRLFNIEKAISKSTRVQDLLQGALSGKTGSAVGMIGAEGKPEGGTPCPRSR